MQNKGDEIKPIITDNPEFFDDDSEEEENSH